MKMKKIIYSFALMLSSNFAVFAYAEIEQMPPDLEARFAVSALPPHLRADATVYLLDPHQGYRLEKSGSNGFSCLVERTEWEKAEYRDDIYAAICWDAAGAKNHQRVWTDVAKMRADGISPEVVKKKIERRFEKKIYKAPTHGGISYMLAPLMRTYSSPGKVDTMAMPHFMFYAPYTTNAEVGNNVFPTPFPFMINPGPHGYMILLLGAAEKKMLLEDSAELLKDLCAYRAVLCLEKSEEHMH
jgi:hypothetical protein